MSGDLSAELSPADVNERLGASAPKPVPGQRVHLWQMAGAWSCWSNGPKAGTRWLMPADDRAHVLVELLRDAPQRGYPVVQLVASGAVLVACKDMRAGAARAGGEA